MTDPLIASQRLRAAIELSDVVIRMRRQHLKRRFPGASNDEIDRMLNVELRKRPGAEMGDGPGEPIPMPNE